MAILAASLRTPHGSTPDEVSAAIVKKKSSADIDHQLHDDEGFPIMTARVRESYDDALQITMADWLVHHNLPDPFNEAQWRALTLACAVVGDLAGAAASALVNHESPARLQLHPVIPSDWNAEQRRISRILLSDAVTQTGWPAASLSIESNELSLPAAISGIDRSNSEKPLAAILVAFDSSLSEETVARWAQERTLFTASNPDGDIPGEASVGVLVADQSLANLNRSQVALMSSVEDAQRGSNKRAGAIELEALTKNALRQAGTDVSTVAAIVADTGHHAGRTAELVAFANKAMPELDATEDVIHAGFACGGCGQVPFMAALALAYQQSLERAAPVLAIGNNDASQRLAAVISPAQLPS